MADKILDLDAAPLPRRGVKLGGREFALSPRTFGALRAFRVASERAGAAEDEAAQSAALLGLVQVVIPDADQALVDLLDPEGSVLARIARHWAGADEDEAAGIAADPLPPG